MVVVAVIVIGGGGGGGGGGNNSDDQHTGEWSDLSEWSGAKAKSDEANG